MILVSAAHDLPSRLQQRAVGISDALEKPGLRAQLPDMLARLTGRAPAPSPRAIACGGSAPGQEVPEAHRLQILVAEDNEVNRLVIRGMLRALWPQRAHRDERARGVRGGDLGA